MTRLLSQRALVQRLKSTTVHSASHHDAHYGASNSRQSVVMVSPVLQVPPGALALSLSSVFWRFLPLSSASLRSVSLSFVSLRSLSWRSVPLSPVSLRFLRVRSFLTRFFLSVLVVGALTTSIGTSLNIAVAAASALTSRAPASSASISSADTLGDADATLLAQDTGNNVVSGEGTAAGDMAASAAAAQAGISSDMNAGMSTEVPADMSTETQSAMSTEAQYSMLAETNGGATGEYAAGAGAYQNAYHSSYYDGNESAASLCLRSFNATRSRVITSNTQSVILLSSPNGIAPYITLQATAENNRRYVLWQSLNGEIRGYALRDGKGFDYNNSANMPLPLSWHPTLLWDNILGSFKEMKNYSCVLTGRTRVMGKRVSLLRLVPQEGLRYAFMIAKEDESNYPVELTILDHKGNVGGRLTTMDSRIIAGVDFPVNDAIFDHMEQSAYSYEEWLSDAANQDNISAAARRAKAQAAANAASGDAVSANAASASASSANAASANAANVHTAEANSVGQGMGANQGGSRVGPTPGALTGAGAAISGKRSQAIITSADNDNDASLMDGSSNSTQTRLHDDIKTLGTVNGGHRDASGAYDPYHQSLADDLSYASPSAGATMNKTSTTNAFIDKEAHAVSRHDGSNGAASTATNKASSKKKVPVWRELNIPTVYTLIDSGSFNDGGKECLYQEFSDGITSFRVYRNQKSTVYYPVLTNGTITIVRKNSSRFEYSVVGEVPVPLAEYVLARITN